VLPGVTFRSRGRWGFAADPVDDVEVVGGVDAEVVDLADVGGGRTGGRGPAASGAGEVRRGTGGVDLRHEAAGVVGDVEVALGVHRHRPGIDTEVRGRCGGVERAAGATAAGDDGQRTGQGDLGDDARGVVGDVEVAGGVERHVHR